MTWIELAALSDMHGKLPRPDDVPHVNLLLIAGDIIPLEIERDVGASVAWLSGPFAGWLDSISVDEVIGIAGNHDLWAPSIGQGVHHRLFGARWTYLQDAALERCGLTIYGTQWVPWLRGSWAFEAPKSHGGEFLARKFWSIPTEPLDVLLSHGPPLGLRDVTVAGAHVGSQALRTAIEHRRPRLVVCGHIHEAAGATSIGPARQRTLIANVSRLDWDYQPHVRPLFRVNVPPRPLPVEATGQHR